MHDIEIDERIPLEAYRPTFVRSLVMVAYGRCHHAGGSRRCALGPNFSDRDGLTRS